MIGAIDGKHIRIECPKNSGTVYHNYKGYYRLVLLAICDADYCFSMFDVGEYGSNNDSGVLANSNIGKRNLKIFKDVSFLHYHIIFWETKYFL